MPTATLGELIPPKPRVSEEAFVAIAWTGFSLCTALVICRFGIRYHKFRRLFLDDFFIATAWLMTLATTIVWNQLASNMYLNNSVARGVAMPPPDFVKRTETFLKSSAAIVVMFYTVLWSIKLSFLFFFRRLYPNVSSWMKYWWVIFALTVATWLACIGSIEYKCLVRPLVEIASHCSSGPSIRYQRETLIANCVMDVMTDILIAMIPLAMLRKVRISMRRKVALGAVFSVTVFTMIFAIIRVSLVGKASSFQDMSWLYFWSNIESYTALIVSSFGSFRSLFTSQNSDERRTPQGEDHPPTIGQGSSKAKKRHSFAHIFSGSLLNSTFGGTKQDSVVLDSRNGELMDYGLLGSEKKEGISVTHSFTQSREGSDRSGEGFVSRV